MTQVFVRRGGTKTGGAGIVFDAAKNLQTGERRFQSVFGSPTTLERDLLLLAASIFAADRCIPRGEREKYARQIELSIPVVNIGILQPFALRLEDLLRTLSQDAWRIRFRQDSGGPEEGFAPTPADGKTLLFSGGLDSLAAAIEFGKKKDRLQLVSHVTRNRQTINAQKVLASKLTDIGLNFPHRAFLVSSRQVDPGAQLDFESESSQRTRSFLFLVLAALCARRAGHTEIVMIAENGQMAIHLPLTQGRIGAYSTHTAHPEVLAKMEDFLRGALNTNFDIVNPYVHKTKAEVVDVVMKHMPEAIPVSVSCWKGSRLPSSATHCGACVPCLLRRIAIESHAKDQTAYARDILSERVSQLPEDDDGRRNLYDFSEFIYRFENFSDTEIMDEWPELRWPHVDSARTIQMYKRAASEARKVLTKYPGMDEFLK